MIKLSKIFIICILLIIILSGRAFAIGQTLTMGESWRQLGRENADRTIDTSLLQENSNKIYNLLLAVAVGTAVIVGAILAIRFMTAGIDKKVEVKESLIPYLISCAVVFGALGIWKMVVQIMGDL